MVKNLMGPAVDILLVMGDLNELSKIRESLRGAKIKNRMHHVGNSDEAISYLRRDGPYRNAPVPGLVLLDASLPLDGSTKLITEMKTGAQFGGIPVIVLVKPESEQTVSESGFYAVDGSIDLPLDPYDLVRLLTTIDTLSFLLVRSAPAK